MDLYSIGEMVIDFFPGETEGIYLRNAGGAPANVAIAVARNGLTAGMCCKVGDDDFGRFLTDTLKKEKVRVLCEKPCTQATTTMAFVTLKEGGERSFTFARKPGADMFLAPEEVREDEIRSAKMIHAGSCSLSAQPAAEATEKAMRLAHEAGKLVSFDINYRNLMWNDDQDACTAAVLRLLPLIDLLKVSEEEVDMLGGAENLPCILEENRITAIVLTLGSAGARVYTKNGSFSAAGQKVHAVDATGAGDAFWGGFLSSLLIQGVADTASVTQERLRTALAYGNVSGGICVQKQGAIASLPSRSEIEAVLNRQ